MVEIAALSSALDAYAIDHGGRYAEDLECLVVPDASGRTYLRGYTMLPLDPWKTPYQYAPSDGGRDFRITCFGKDGQPGGSGDDADIDNRALREKSRAPR